MLTEEDARGAELLRCKRQLLGLAQDADFRALDARGVYEFLRAALALGLELASLPVIYPPWLSGPEAVARWCVDTFDSMMMGQTMNDKEVTLNALALGVDQLRAVLVASGFPPLLPGAQATVIFRRPGTAGVLPAGRPSDRAGAESRVEWLMQERGGWLEKVLYVMIGVVLATLAWGIRDGFLPAREGEKIIEVRVPVKLPWTVKPAQ